MKVLHVNGGGLDGGASRGAYWLHKGLIGLGVQSTFLTQYGSKDSLPSNVTCYSDSLGRSAKSFVNEWSDRLLVLKHLNRQRVLFSPGLCGVDITKLAQYKEADIIHLHWINNGFIPLEFFEKCDKKIVWTLRDAWPFTGGCHVFYDCDRYLTGCGECPVLGTKSVSDLSKKVWDIKSEVLSRADVTVVSISSWIAQIADKSPLFSNSRRRTILNGIEVESFTPTDKKIAREELNLDKDSKIVLCGAVNIDVSISKGLDDIIEATKSLAAKDSYENITLLVFGTTKIKDFAVDNLNIKFLGKINNNSKLSKFYSASDVFVSGAKQEPFGKTLVEAMACTTPVVSYNAAGPSDIIVHGETGYLADSEKPEGLLTGIDYVIGDEERNLSMGAASRERALDVFSNRVSAEQYKNLYSEILNK